jgi:hypothetical protein
MAGEYAVPLGQATPAARRRGVLGDEHRVPAEGRLLAVVGGPRRREPLGDEGAGVHQDGFPAPGPQVVPLARRQPEAAPEC